MYLGEDFSNYWTANLYFKARNGSYKRVPQLGHAYVSPIPVMIFIHCLPVL